MSATCILFLDAGEKEIKKRFPDSKSAVDWLIAMMANPRFKIGYTDDGQWAVASNFHLWPSENAK